MDVTELELKHEISSLWPWITQSQTYNHSNFHAFTEDMMMRAVRYRTKLELISNPRTMSSLGVGPDLARLFKRDKTLHKMTNFGTQHDRRTHGRIVCYPDMQEFTGTALDDLQICIDRFALHIDFDSGTTSCDCQCVISAEIQVKDTHTGESKYVSRVYIRCNGIIII